MWSLSLVMSECSLSGHGQGHVSNFYIVDLENFATASRRYTGDIHNSTVVGLFIYTSLFAQIAATKQIKQHTKLTNSYDIFSMNKVEYKNSSNTKTRIRWWNKAVCIIVGRFQLLARWPGTHSRILSGIQRAAQTILCVYLKRICSRVTNASSALGVLNDYALYKSTQSLTHSPSCLLI